MIMVSMLMIMSMIQFKIKMEIWKHLHHLRNWCLFFRSIFLIHRCFQFVRFHLLKQIVRRQFQGNYTSRFRMSEAVDAKNEKYCVTLMSRKQNQVFNIAFYILILWTAQIFGVSQSNFWKASLSERFLWHDAWHKKSAELRIFWIPVPKKYERIIMLMNLTVRGCEE